MSWQQRSIIMSCFIPRILIVDDQVELLGEVSDYFRRKAEVVSTATCFKEARDVLHVNSPWSMF